MSRNSKEAKRHAEARQRRRAKQEGKTIVSMGSNGPKQTTPKHGKKNAWWQKNSRPQPWWAKTGVDQANAKVAE
jgi:hypothetical protein